MTTTAIIYVLFDTRSPGDIRYVGVTTKTLEKRLRGHLESTSRNTHRSAWINKVIGSGGSIGIQEVDRCQESEWQSKEREWISYYREAGYDLVNSTDGGRGVLNPSGAVRDKISKSMSIAKRGNTNRLGTKTSPDGVENMRRAQKERGALPEVREANRQKALRTSRDNAIRAWAKRSPEKRREIADKVKKTWTDPELRKNAIANMKSAGSRKRNGWNGMSAEARTARVSRASAWQADEEKKKIAANKMSAKARALWENPDRKREVLAKRKRTLQIKRALAATNALVDGLLEQARGMVASREKRE